MTVEREVIADTLFTAAAMGIGFATGNPILASIVGGISVNLASKLVEGGWGQVCQRVILASSDPLNHDLQKALARAFDQAIDQLERVWWKGGQGSQMRRQGQAEPVEALFRDLRAKAVGFCASDCLGRAAGNAQVRQLLYGDEQTVRRALSDQLAAYLYGHDPQVVAFLEANLVRELAFCFGEDLKTDRPESNKAWRAFQRLLLEGVQAGVADLQAGMADMRAGQEEIQAVLAELRAWADRMAPLPWEVREPTGMPGLVQAVADLSSKVDDLSGRVTAGFGSMEKRLDELPGRIETIVRVQLGTARTLTSSPDRTPPYASILPVLEGHLRDMVLRNRAHELKTLLHHVAEDQVTFIIGLGGIGKTTLARVLLEMRPAGIPSPMWIDFFLEPGIDLDGMLGKFASYLGSPELCTYKHLGQKPDHDDIDRLIDQLSKSAPLWLVFDNLESLLDEDGRFHDADLDFLLQRLLTRQSQAHLIVCSRRLPVLQNPGAAKSTLRKSTVALKGLSLSHSITLLRKSGLTKANRTQLEQLVQKVDGHPYALELLSPAAKERGVGKVLADSQLWQTTPDAKAFVSGLFSQLQPVERRLLAGLSVFRQPQPPDVLVTLATGGPGGEQAFQALCERVWLAIHRAGETPLYRLHPLIQELAALELVDPDQRTRAHQKAYEIYREVQMPPAHQWCHLEDITPLIEAHYHAIQAKAIDHAATILLEHALPDYLEQWGAEDRLIKLCRETFGTVPENASYADYLGSVGYDGLLKGNSDDRACRYRQLGKCARYLDDYSRALDCYEQGLGLLGEESDLWELARFERESAFVLQRLGRREEALTRCLRGLKLIQSVEDRQGLMDKAALHMRAGAILLDDAAALAESETHFEQARAIYEQLAMTARAYEADDNIGLVRSMQGRYEEALAIFTKIHEYYEREKYSVRDGHTRLNMGDALTHLGRYEEARLLMTSVLDWFKEIGDQFGQSLCLYNLGELLMMMDPPDYTGAIAHLEEALSIARKTGDEGNLPDILYLLGKAYAYRLKVKLARQHIAEAIKAARDVNNQETLEKAQQMLAELDTRQAPR